MPQRRHLIASAIVVLLLALLPLAGSRYAVDLATEVMIYALFALSLNVLIGFTGNISFGHAAYFAIVLLMSDAAKMIWGTDQYSVGYPPGMGGAVNLGFVMLPQYQLFLCVVGPLIAVAMWFVVDRTRWGRVVRAATQDREMLAALGVNVPMVYAAVFTIGSALAGVGGALAAPRIALVPGMDATIINECFIIVIIGGLGNLWGSFLGALAFGFVVQFGTVWVPNWQDVLPYVLMLVVLIIRPWGILGRPETGH